MKEEELRKSILQMAIQGKLVEQDPNDEPASVLLERIREEKQKLIKEGKIKKDKDDSYIFKGDDNRYYEKIGKEVKDITDELPFEIPNSWCWVRHNDIIEISGGAQPPKSEFITEPKDGYIRLYQIRDYGKNPEPIYIPIQTATKQTKKGDILLARYGASVGKVFWAEDGAYNVAMAKVIKLFTNDNINMQYLYLFYKSNTYQSLVLNNSRSAQAGFNKDDLNTLLLPLPPLKEQERIYKKINDFVPIFDEYAKYEQIDNELDANIYDTLKKSILQYAIQGKLVPQDENDEPASVLLERIRAEKKAKLGKKYVDSYIYKGDDNCYYEHINGKDIDITDKIPFEISSNWSWCKLPHIGHSELGKTMDKGKNTGEPREYLCSINVYWNEIKLDKIKQALFENNEIDKYTVQKGDLLICEGGDVGRCAIWDRDNKILYQNALHRVRFFNNINPKYFMYVIILFKANNIIDNHSKGLTIKHLVQNSLYDILFPIPPLVEQQRLVECIESIFAMLQ